MAQMGEGQEMGSASKHDMDLDLILIGIGNGGVGGRRHKQWGDVM